MIKTDPFSLEEFSTNKRNKKFASKDNQIAYNNEVKAQERENLKFINDKLIHNRKVLKSLLSNQDEVLVSQDKLHNLDFAFTAITHYKTDENKTVFAVYEYTYIILKNNVVKIQKNGRDYIY